MEPGHSLSLLPAEREGSSSRTPFSFIPNDLCLNPVNKVDNGLRIATAAQAWGYCCTPNAQSEFVAPRVLQPSNRRSTTTSILCPVRGHQRSYRVEEDIQAVPELHPGLICSKALPLATAIRSVPFILRDFTVAKNKPRVQYVLREYILTRKETLGNVGCWHLSTNSIITCISNLNRTAELENGESRDIPSVVRTAVAWFFSTPFYHLYKNRNGGLLKLNLAVCICSGAKLTGPNAFPRPLITQKVPCHTTFNFP